MVIGNHSESNWLPQLRLWGTLAVAVENITWGYGEHQLNSPC